MSNTIQDAFETWALNDPYLSKIKDAFARDCYSDDGYDHPVVNVALRAWMAGRTLAAPAPPAAEPVPPCPEPYRPDSYDLECKTQSEREHDQAKRNAEIAEWFAKYGAAPPASAPSATEPVALPSPYVLELDTPGADSDITYVDSMDLAKDMLGGYEGDDSWMQLITPLFTADQMRAYAAEAMRAASNAQPLSEERIREGFRANDEAWPFKDMTAWQVWSRAVQWVERAYRAVQGNYPAAPDGWRPIETAPTDGSMFLCWVSAERWSSADGEGSGRSQDVSQVDFCWHRRMPYDHEQGYFDNAAGQIGDGQDITHWMPLPAAPSTGAEGTIKDRLIVGDQR